MTNPRTNLLAEVRSLAVLALLVIGFQSLVAKPFYIPSESMMPTLRVGDQLVVSKYPYGWSYASASFHLLPFLPGRLSGRLPARGDIVILSPPDDDHRGEDLIKRVVGLPGDTIQMVDGRLWLNEKPVATRDLGYRLMPIDSNFHCDPADPDPERAFPGFVGARVIEGGQPYCRLHVIRETLPGGRSYDTLDFGHSDADDFGPYLAGRPRLRARRQSRQQRRQPHTSRASRAGWRSALRDDWRQGRVRHRLAQRQCDVEPADMAIGFPKRSDRCFTEALSLASSSRT